MKNRKEKKKIMSYNKGFKPNCLKFKIRTSKSSTLNYRDFIKSELIGNTSIYFNIDNRKTLVNFFLNDVFIYKRYSTSELVVINQILVSNHLTKDEQKNLMYRFRHRQKNY